jgi:hypothetical protein
MNVVALADALRGDRVMSLGVRARDRRNVS